MARDVYQDQDEVVARPDGLGMALIYITFAVLIVGNFLCQKLLKDHYNAGIFKDPENTPVVGS